MKTIISSIAFSIVVMMGCSPKKLSTTGEPNVAFLKFEDRFLDLYWQQYPSGAVYSGYGKYYDKMVVADSAAFADNLAFSRRWLDSLTNLGYNALNDNNKISFNIIRNQLESDIWYTSVFKQQEWDASMYNISGPCDYIINQPYAPLTERLKILLHYLEPADKYYSVAIRNLRKPTMEHIELAVQQNIGGMDVLGKALEDSIAASQLSIVEKDSLQQNIQKALAAMKGYAEALQKILSNKNYTFRDFRIGKALFDQKFKYDIVTDLTPEQVYDMAMADKQLYHRTMFVLADSIWTKYYSVTPKPADSLQLVQMVISKIQLQHATPAGFFAQLNQQVYDLKRFIIDKDLFAFDTNSAPIKVRYMPVYERGVTIASAEFIPPYQKKGATYYNIDDLTTYPPAKAESALRESNDYASQILSIHEAVPGHCLQGIYNNKKSPDVVRSVFTNGPMIEGWAVYTEKMMIDNGWGNHSAEIQLMLGIWRLRELANVIIDYDIQCMNAPKERIVHLLSKECFQTDQQVQEKYHRATLSQVQLCSYYTGATAIQLLRDDYQKKMGEQYSLKDFHEKFLSFGSSPVKYIRERMMQ